MLRTTKNMKEKYEKIQTYLFSMIPEKWDEIYLYASVVTSTKKSGTGELFFYYLPKGILKKRPINVYEVPQRFNINDEQYLNLVEQLYNCIKDLKQDFIDTEQELWNSVTISVVNSRFKIEFDYGALPANEKESNEMHIIWRYKYLKAGGEKKEERKILEHYFSCNRKEKKETYETGLYMKTDNNFVTFDKDNFDLPKEVVVYEKESNEKEVQEPKIEIEEDTNNKETENFKAKNQILGN